LNGYRSWLAALGQISWSAHVANASLLGLLTRTLSTTPEILHATPIVDRPALVPPLWTAGIVLIAALGVRALVATKNLDRAWAVLLVGSLLVSPLGWVYYATMFTGPLLAVAMASGRWTRITIAAGYGCLLVPPVGVPSPGPIGVVVLGSIYGWGLLMVYAAVALARDPRR
jgi:hypothetical protein